MKRTLTDTERNVRIVIDNFSNPRTSADRWSATVGIDGTYKDSGIFGTSAEDALAKLRVKLEEGEALDDRPVALPEKDRELLSTMLRGIARTWGFPREIPNWRQNDFIRGQIQLVIETCRILTDDEVSRGDGDMEMMSDRVATWIETEAWR